VICTVLVLVLASAAVSRADAYETIVGCRYQQALVPGTFARDYHHLRIEQAAPRVDDYLDRCQVATFVAASADGARTIKLMGARWFIAECHQAS
jgi:hypothetical protein